MTRAILFLLALLAALPAHARTRARTDVRAVPDAVAARYSFAPSGATITTGTMLEPLTVTGPATPVCASGQCWTAPANTLAIGPEGALVYGSRVSRILNNQRSSANTATGGMLSASWTKRGTATVAAGCVTDPFGGCTAEEITVGAGGTNDILQVNSGFGASAALANSVWLQKVTSTGTFVLDNPRGSSYGKWSVNLAALSDGWTLLTSTHPAVTQSAAWTATAGGLAGHYLYSATADMITVRIHRPWQVEGSIPGPDAEVGASPLSVAAMNAYSDVPALSDTEGCVAVLFTPPDKAVDDYPRVIGANLDSLVAPLWLPQVRGGTINQMAFWDGTNQIGLAETFQPGSTVAALVRWKGTEAGITNLSTGTTATGSYDGALWDANKRVFIGHITNGFQGLNGSIKEVVLGRTVDGCSLSSTPEPVVCLGDSITFNGYPGVLQTLLGASHTVANSGVSGNMTSQMLARWRSDLKGRGFKRLVLLGGVNDVASDMTAEASYANLSTIISEAKADGLRVIVSTILPWKGSGWWSADRQVQTEALNVLIRATAGVTVVDGYAAFGTAGDPATLAAAYDSGDHIHPNATGNGKLAELVRGAIR